MEKLDGPDSADRGSSRTRVTGTDEIVQPAVVTGPLGARVGVCDCVDVLAHVDLHPAAYQCPSA